LKWFNSSQKPIRPLVLSGIVVFGLLILNLILIWPIFQGSFSPYPDSFRAVFLSLAEFLEKSWSHPFWYPNWQLGLPFHLIYNPGLPFILAVLHKIFSGQDLGHISRVVLGICSLLTPISLYLFVRYLTKREFAALLAGLAYSVPVNFWVLFFPRLRESLFGAGFLPSRLIFAVQDGQVAHAIALFFLPLVGLAFLADLKRPRFYLHFLTALGVAMVGFLHWPSLWVAVVLLAVLLFSEILIGQSGQKIRIAFICFVFTLLFLAPVYNISFLRGSFQYAQNAGIFQNWARLVPLSLVVLPIVVTVLFLIFDRRPRLQSLLIAFLWTGLFLVAIFADQVYDKNLLPNPGYLVSELSMANALLIGLIGVLLVNFMRRLLINKVDRRTFNFLHISFYVLFLGIFLLLAQWTAKDSHKMLVASQNITSSREYRIAQYLENNFSNSERVYAAGRASLWLNVFADIPQVKGQSQLVVMPEFYDKAIEQIEKGESGEQAILWLKLMGVKYLVVTPEDFTKPEKFAKLLPVVETAYDYTIYEIPTSSVAHLVSKNDWQDFEKNYPQVKEGEGLAQYIKILEPVEINWQKPYKVDLQTQINEEKILVLAIPYYKQWQAKIAGKKIDIDKDPYGFLAIPLPLTGMVDLRVSYSVPIDVILGFILAAIGLLGGLLIWLDPKLKKQLEFSLIPEELPEKELQKINNIQKVTKEYHKTSHTDWVKMTDDLQEFPSYFHRQRVALILKMIQNFKAEKRFLDVGCGNGVILRYLPEGSMGLDINAQAISQAKQYAPKAQVQIGDVEELPFQDNSYETIICSHVLDHLPKPEKALKEIYRVLKPGGVLIGTVPRYNPLWQMQFIAGPQVTAYPYHHEFNEEELRKILAPFDSVELSPVLSYLAWAFVVRKPEKKDEEEKGGKR